jgi:hypothetical protein
VTPFFALHESAIGPKQTLASALHMSASGGKADMLEVPDQTDDRPAAPCDSCCRTRGAAHHRNGN